MALSPFKIASFVTSPTAASRSLPAKPSEISTSEPGLHRRLQPNDGLNGPADPLLKVTIPFKLLLSTRDRGTVRESLSRFPRQRDSRKRSECVQIVSCTEVTFQTGLLQTD